MTTAKDIVRAGATCAGERETLTAAAQHDSDLGVGALPICRDDDRLHGMVTDRQLDRRAAMGDIHALFAGLDPNTTVGELARATTSHADASVEETLTVIGEHQVCRPPVIEGHRVVVMVSEADIAPHLRETHAIAHVKAIYAPRARR